VAILLLLTVSAFAGESVRAAGAASRENPGKGNLEDVYNRTPKKPFIFDGVAMPAGTQLPDRQLHWVISKEDYEKGTFRVYSSPEAAKEYMKTRQSDPGNTPGRGLKQNWPGSCSWTNSYTRFEKSRWCGDSAWLSMYPPYGSYSQLDSISWNNSISCVYAACDWYWTTLYACRYFSTTYSYPDCQDPDSLAIEGGLIVGDLDDFGFNNRTSSTRFE
jgi:hypothetical protein